MNTKTIRPIAAAIGASFLAISVIPTASADANPFSITELSSGYELASADKSGAEGKCGEGKCGGSPAKHKGSKVEGEGKCGGSNAGSAGKSEKAEGKCGEGKCGGTS